MNAGEKAKQSNPAEEKSKYLSRKAKYACTMCDTACDRFQRLQKHMKIVHNIDLEPPEPKEPSEKHYSCAVPDCDFVAPTKKLLHAHWREVHEDVKVCMLLSKFMRLPTLIYHFECIRLLGRS